MFTEADDVLGDMERRMLKLLSDEIRRVEDDDTEARPIPAALGKLYKDVHASVLQRMAKNKGLNIDLSKQSPSQLRSMLVMLDKQSSLIRKMLEQQESKSLRVVG